LHFDLSRALDEMNGEKKRLDISRTGLEKRLPRWIAVCPVREAHQASPKSFWSGRAIKQKPPP